MQAGKTAPEIAAKEDRLELQHHSPAWLHCASLYDPAHRSGEMLSSQHGATAQDLLAVLLQPVMHTVYQEAGLQPILLLQLACRSQTGHSTSDR